MAKNPIQPFRDLLPYYPGCIRTFIILTLSVLFFSLGAMFIADGRPSNYTRWTYIGDGKYNYIQEGVEADVGKLVGGSIMVVLAIPMLLGGIYYYMTLGCGFNRFYTNDLVKFPGGKAVKRARKARR